MTTFHEVRFPDNIASDDLSLVIEEDEGAGSGGQSALIVVVLM